MQDVDRTEYGLRKVHLHEWLGYAWVCLADNPPSFEGTIQAEVAERLGGDAVIGGWSVAELALGRRITYDVKANWKLIIENFMECYHCATIHPELTEVLPEFADVTRRSTTSDMARDSVTISRRSPSTAARRSASSTASGRNTTGATTPSRSGRRYSLTWSRIT
jgi:phenylpropionate dioxygenase-like ring-hydroxylating dioxygenase large terminal subunit